MNWNAAALAEIAFPGDVKRGDHGMAVRRVQEHLCLRGFALKIDGDERPGGFGGVTEQIVREFQGGCGLPPNGVVDARSWSVLVTPLANAFSVEMTQAHPLPTLAAAMNQVMWQHRVEKPREVGGNNRGPWQRAYMHGHENRPGDPTNWAGCVGAVATMLGQAAAALGVESPLGWQTDANDLVAAAKAQGRFVEGMAVWRAITMLGAPQPPARIFVHRHFDADGHWDEKRGWEHAGGAMSFGRDAFRTAEFNYGSSTNGRMVSIARGYAANDFIELG